MGIFDLLKRGHSDHPSFEQQLRVLQKGGIALAPGIAPEALLESFSREEFERTPYRLLLSTMGESDGPSYLSHQIWHFDPECIEDHGAYKHIASRFSALAGGALPLHQIEDHVDLDAAAAWLSFTLDGTPHKWTAEVNNDWVDPTVLSRFGELLVARSTDHRFTFVNLGAQDCLIGCATAQQRDWLNSNTGLAFEWLK